jgi:tetratricopeptide (TPR) repeat protein
MKLPHWQDLVCETAIFPEPIEDGLRIVLWIRGAREHRYQYWERIGSVARGEITEQQGLCTIAAVSVRARERVGSSIAGLWKDLRGPRGDRRYLLPNGRSVEQCGERQTDLLLVWTEPEHESLDEARLKGRWPEGTRFSRLARNLFLVAGIKTETAKPERAALQAEAAPTGTPREIGEQALAAARQSGDRHKEAAALVDLGAINLNEGDAKGAAAILEEALVLARQLGDQTQESDVLGNLALAALALRQPVRARQLLEQELSLIRARNDPFAEKLALERLGITAWNTGNPAQALALFESALAVARKVGDRHQEATLLWQQAIQHAELGQRDFAVAKAEESITLMKLQGKPQAGWYGSQLQKYRIGVEDGSGAAIAESGPSASPQAYLGGAIVASVMAQQPTPPAAQAKPRSGPSMLRMAMSATKAMANFVGAGFKTATPELQQRRLQTCSTCEHYTGMRCKICGCFIQVKSRMLAEDCPIGKWPAVPSDA